MRLAYPGVVALSVLLAAASGCAAHEADDADTTEAAIGTIEPQLGESLEANEEAMIREVAEAASSQVKRSPPDTKIAKRDAHPKAHGCVTAKFKVADRLPADLAVGTWKPGKSYEAWVRFSNGSKEDDGERDARGMAIKLLGAPGKNRLLTSEGPGATTHDIVLTNHHTFFLRNLADYTKFMKAATEKANPLSFFISLNPFDFHINLRELFLAASFTGQPISNPLTARYWSATAYKLGNQAVKYSAMPCGGADRSGDHADDPNYLRTALRDTLSSGRAGCFDFAIQRRTRPDQMPVEDASITWEEDDAPFTTIARIEIPPQVFDTDAQNAFCENLSFTPWHATDDHRPLGRMNRTRKVVYEATQEKRHRLNGVERREPTSLAIQP
jgi:catalase